MMVQRRSRAESTVDAIRDRDDEKKQATILAARRNMLATTLICRYVSNTGSVKAWVGYTNVDGSLGSSLGFLAVDPFFFGKEGFDVLALSLQGTAVFQETIMVSVGVEGF